FFRPVPPASQPNAAERMVSWAALVKNWYLSVISRLPKPLSVLSFGAGSRLFHSPASVSPRLGKMRFENSPEMFAVLLDGSSPWLGSLKSRKVGSESSSDTNGSWIVRVDGKKRLPASPCAVASEGHKPRASRAASAARERNLMRCVQSFTGK